MIRHGRHVPSQCPKQKHFSPEILKMVTSPPEITSHGERFLTKDTGNELNFDKSIHSLTKRLI